MRHVPPFGQELFQGCVDWSEAPVVSDLKHVAAVAGFNEDSFGVGDVGCQWFLAEDVFAGVNAGKRECDVLRVWRGDVDRIATVDNLVWPSRNTSVVRASQSFRTLTFNVVNCRKQHALVTCKYSSVHTADVTGADNTNSDFMHCSSAHAQSQFSRLSPTRTDPSPSIPAGRSQRWQLCRSRSCETLRVVRAKAECQDRAAGDDCLATVRAADFPRR